ncbi:MAG: hypothetical protein LBI38_07530 [Oscillospiraceae bacterium]|jgi:flagellar M-ring protein FliF|nr:hypothetical protein [Oscillospiraceae bacterium]
MGKIKETFGRVFGPVKERWLGIAGKTRVIILAIAGVVVASAIILTIVLNNAGYTVLYKASSLSEANEILSVLSGLGNGSARVGSNNEILVPTNTEGDLRWQLSLQGYPRPSNLNNDIWNTSVGMFATETEKRVAQVHQLQDWLMATYNTIPEVESSMVILNIPDQPDYVFVENRQESGVSIKLNLKSGRTLDSNQINGVYNLARTAVPNLKSENITVTDGNGVMLAYADSTGDGAESLQLKQQRYAMELGYSELVAEKLKAQLGGLLTGVFGKYTMAVHAKMDFSDKVTEEITYTPIVGLDGGILRNITEKYGVGGLLEEGLPAGTFDNADISPDYPTIPAMAAGSDYYLEWLRESNYEINQKIEQYTDSGMRRVDVTATVLVDSLPLPDADIQMWVKAVADAIGADVANVSFVAVPFPSQPSPGREAAGAGGDSTRNLLIYIIICLGALLIILFALAIMTSGSKKKRQVSYRGAPPVVSGAGQGFVREEYQPAPEPEGFELPSLLEESETKDVVLKREIREFSRSNPEIVAQLIRTWLRDEE